MPASTNSPLFIKYWLPVIIYAIIIFSISSIPGKAIPPIFKYQDVVFHFVEYAFLSVLLNRALKAVFIPDVKIRRFCWVFILCLLYALGDELHQLFVPHRVASLYDIATDGLGALVADIIYLWRR
ncbi:MAG: VanZ family protein [Candidatus Omnitrophota bacterium]